MNDWSRYLFGAAIFFGAGVMMLGGELTAWWRIVSLVVMSVAAVVFLTRSIVEFRRTCNVAASTE